MFLSFYKPGVDLASRKRTTPEKLRHIIQDPKIMATIAWNPLGFHLLDALPKGNTFNIEYYRVNILTESIPLRLQVDGKRLVIHADNARRHAVQKWQVFVKKISSASPYTQRTRLISHHPTSFSSNISNIVCMESLFHHVENYLQQFIKSSRPSCD
jgi:hypothetical protein